MKTRAMLSVLALAALAACGGDEGETSGGVDTTATAAPVMTDTAATMAPPPMAPMGTDSMGMTGDSAMGGAAAQTDTLIKTDSTTKM